MALEYNDGLLKKYIIEEATTQSAEHVNDVANLHADRTSYILRVLRASVATQAYVRDLAAAANSDGEHQLAVILTVFATLSAEDKVLFIQGLKRRVTVQMGGSRNIVLRNTWQWNHVPPIFPP